MYLDIGASASRANSCFVAYIQPNNTLYLFNDAGTGLVSGSITEGGPRKLVEQSMHYIERRSGDFLG